MLGILILMAFFLVIISLYFLRLVTLRKQAELDPREFQLWFQRYYLGMTYPEAPPTEIPQRREKAEEDRQLNTSIKAAFMMIRSTVQISIHSRCLVLFLAKKGEG